MNCGVGLGRRPGKQDANVTAVIAPTKAGRTHIEQVVADRKKQ